MEMIESKDNEKLKLVRRLGDRRHRERTRLFAVEGEDLLAAGRAAGLEPRLVLSAAGSGLGGVEVEPEVLATASTLGSGSRVISVWGQRWADHGDLSKFGTAAAHDDERPGQVWVYLHGVGDPGNVGAVIRSAHALVDAVVALGPGCADPYSPKATRASMGSIFAQPVTRAEMQETPEPRVALVAHGGEAERPPRIGTLCLGAEREGLPAAVLDACAATWTIPLRPGGAESLNAAAAAAIALSGISSALAEGGPG